MKEETNRREIRRMELIVGHYKKLSLASRDFILSKLWAERRKNLPEKRTK